MKTRSQRSRSAAWISPEFGGGARLSQRAVRSDSTCGALGQTRPPLHGRCRTGERGSAVFVLIALLSIMLVLVAANGRTLVLLKKEIRLIEQRQIQRLQRSQTNAPVAVILEAQPTPAAP